MKSTIYILALFAGANGLTTRWTSCCFDINVSGAVTGTAGQLDDGQVRVNGPLPAAQFCIANGEITDSEGRGCFFTRKSIITYEFKADCHQHQPPSFNVMSGRLQFPGSALGVTGPFPTMEELLSGNVKLEIRSVQFVFRTVIFLTS